MLRVHIRTIGSNGVGANWDYVIEEYGDYCGVDYIGVFNRDGGYATQEEALNAARDFLVESRGDDWYVI